MNIESISWFGQIIVWCVIADLLVDGSRANRYAITVMLVVLGWCHGGVYQWSVSLASSSGIEAAGVFILCQGTISFLWYLYFSSPITTFFRMLLTEQRRS